MDIIWKGRYSKSKVFDESKSYEFELKVKLDRGSFSGISLEDFSIATNGEYPTIKGFIDDDHISFVKTYPYRYIHDANGNRVIDPTKKGHEVVYDGYFNTDFGIWEGRWEIVNYEIKLNKDSYQTFYIVGCWQMKRI